MRAWTCTIGHGTFLQAGMDALPMCTRSLPGLVVEGRKQPTMSGMSRYVCPVCAATGEPGFVCPATDAEVIALERPDLSAAELNTPWSVSRVDRHWPLISTEAAPSAAE